MKKIRFDRISPSALSIRDLGLSQRDTNSVNHSVRHWVSSPLSQSHQLQTRQPEIISYPDLFLMKPKARSGQARKFSFFDRLDCERMTWVLSSACAIMAWAIHSFCKVFSSVQINILLKKWFIRLNITCNHFYLIFSDFLKLSNGVNKDL